MMRVAVLTLLVLPAVHGCGENPPLPVDEVAAYRALLGELVERDRKVDEAFAKALPEWSTGEGEPLEQIVVERQPVDPSKEHPEVAANFRWPRLSKRLPALRRDTFEDFWSRNRHPILPALEKAGRIDVVFDDVLPNWQLFSMDYPNGMLVCLSAMGFSRDGRQGLVYVVFPGALGACYLLRFDGEDWRITAECEIWVS